MPTLLVVDDAPKFPRGGEAMIQNFGWGMIEANAAANGFRMPVNGS